MLVRRLMDAQADAESQMGAEQVGLDTDPDEGDWDGSRGDDGGL